MNPNYQQGPPNPPPLMPTPEGFGHWQQQPLMNPYPMPLSPHMPQNQLHWNQQMPMNNNYPPGPMPIEMTMMQPHPHQWHGPVTPHPHPQMQIPDRDPVPISQSRSAYSHIDRVPRNTLNFGSSYTNNSQSVRTRATMTETNAVPPLNPRNLLELPFNLSQLNSTLKHRLFTGVVTSVEKGFGFVGSKILYENSEIQGPKKELKVGDYVFLAATRVKIRHMEMVKWKCVQIGLLEDRSITWNHLIVPFQEKDNEDQEEEMTAAKSSPISAPETSMSCMNKSKSKSKSVGTRSTPERQGRRKSPKRSDRLRKSRSRSRVRINSKSSVPRKRKSTQEDKSISESSQTIAHSSANQSDTPHSGNSREVELIVISDETIEGDERVVSESEPIQNAPTTPESETINADIGLTCPVPAEVETEGHNENPPAMNDPAIQSMQLSDGQPFASWQITDPFQAESQPQLQDVMPGDPQNLETPSNIEIKKENEAENQSVVNNVSQSQPKADGTLQIADTGISPPIKAERIDVNALDEASMDSTSTVLWPTPEPTLTEGQSGNSVTDPVPGQTTSSANNATPALVTNTDTNPNQKEKEIAKNPKESHNTRLNLPSEIRKIKLNEKTERTKFESLERQIRQDRMEREREERQERNKRLVTTRVSSGTRRRPISLNRIARRAVQTRSHVQRRDNDRGFHDERHPRRVSADRVRILRNSSRRSSPDLHRRRQALLPTPSRQRERDEEIEIYSNQNYENVFSAQHYPTRDNVSEVRFKDMDTECLRLRPETKYTPINSAYRNLNNNGNHIDESRGYPSSNIYPEERYCSYHKNYGHSKAECRALQRKTSPQCIFCTQFGHGANDCPRKPKRPRRSPILEEAPPRHRSS